MPQPVILVQMPGLRGPKGDSVGNVIDGGNAAARIFEIKARRDTAANFLTENPILGDGEPAYETDQNKLKFGDGVTDYDSLPYFADGAGFAGGFTQTTYAAVGDQDSVIFAGPRQQVIVWEGLANLNLKGISAAIPTDVGRTIVFINSTTSFTASIQFLGSANPAHGIVTPNFATINLTPGEAVVLTYGDGASLDVWGTVAQVRFNASQSQAEAGTDNEKPMTALRVKQAIDFNAPTAPVSTDQAAADAAVLSAAGSYADTNKLDKSANLADVADPSTARANLAAQAQDSDLDAIAALTPANDDIIQRKSGAWVNRNVAQYLADLGITLSTGDGSLGDVTLSAGVTTLTEDAYYNNLTINGTGQLNTNGFMVFVREALDMSAAPENAIFWNGNNGVSATAAAGGAAPAIQSGGTLGGIGRGIAGAAGVVGAGAQGAAAAAVAVGNGGSSGASGAGGAGIGGAGGISRAGAAITQQRSIRYATFNFLRADVQIASGAGAPGGGSGSGDLVNTGRGGGSGSSSGGTVIVVCKTLIRGASTAASAVSARSGIGGNGASATVGNVGGGGGSGSGGGGWIYFLYQILSGSVATNMFDASSKAAGNGGNGFGTGIGGNGGNSGQAGRITLINMQTHTVAEVFGSSGNAGSAGLGTVGGVGGVGSLSQASL